MIKWKPRPCLPSEETCPPTTEQLLEVVTFFLAHLLFASHTHSQSPFANESHVKLLHHPHRNQGQDSGTQGNPNLLMLKALASSETIQTVNWDCLVNTRLLHIWSSIAHKARHHHLAGGEHGCGAAEVGQAARQQGARAAAQP